MNYLKETLKSEIQPDWRKHWILDGFNAVEQMLQKSNTRGRFCFGDTPGMADVFLIPQVYNALRFECELKTFPLISSIYQNCMQETAFFKAAPENQPDAER
jgi:maleylacetoacetate isomerase